jgi:uncharacterized protein (DUF362 family)
MLESHESSMTPISPADRRDAAVSVQRATPTREGVIEAVRQAMELADWKRYVPQGAEVSIKPNLGWDKLIPGSISAPWVVEGVIHAIRGHVGRICLVESDQVVVDVERALVLTGLDAVCRRENVTWVNMSRGPFVRLRQPDRLALRDVEIPEILLRTAVITVPLMKTHNKTTVTGAIKNQWGCLRALRHSFHLVLAEALVDVNLMVQPRFAVMDGTVGLEGNGPKSGMPKEMGLVLASANLVGLDATAARIMSFDPHDIQHLELCSRHGLGSLDGFGMAGVPVSEVAERFVPAAHNAVSWLELALRKSWLRRAVFDTKLLELMSWGARRYYDLWDYSVGSRLRREFFASSPYAAQWSSRGSIAAAPGAR